MLIIFFSYQRQYHSPKLILFFNWFLKCTVLIIDFINDWSYATIIQNLLEEFFEFIVQFELFSQFEPIIFILENNNKIYSWKITKNIWRHD